MGDGGGWGEEEVRGGLEKRLKEGGRGRRSRRRPSKKKAHHSTRAFVMIARVFRHSLLADVAMITLRLFRYRNRIHRRCGRQRKTRSIETNKKKKLTTPFADAGASISAAAAETLLLFFLARVAVADAANEGFVVTIARRPLQLAEAEERRKAAEEEEEEEEGDGTAATATAAAFRRGARPWSCSMVLDAFVVFRVDDARALVLARSMQEENERREGGKRSKKEREECVFFLFFFPSLPLLSLSLSLLLPSFDLLRPRLPPWPPTSKLFKSSRFDRREREIEFVSWRDTSSWEAIRATGGGQGEKMQRNPSPPLVVFEIASRARSSYEKINSLAAHDSALHFVFSTRPEETIYHA